MPKPLARGAVESGGTNLRSTGAELAVSLRRRDVAEVDPPLF